MTPTRYISSVVIVVALASNAICQSRLPRVRPLNPDQPGSSSTVGCANHPMTFTRDDSSYVFDSHEDGRDAWMNLDGRNVRLTLLRSSLVYTHDDRDTTYATYEYRSGPTRITVRLILLSDYTAPVPGSIRLIRGKLQRTYRAFVAPQCDAI